MKRSPVLCVWTHSLIRKRCRVYMSFACNVWTGFFERVATTISSHALNVGKRFMFLEVEILRIFQLTFASTVSLTRWPSKSAVLMELNCDVKSSKSFYCFQCCIFWCEACVIGHNVIISNKEHRVLVLKDFKEQDFQHFWRRPEHCRNRGLEREELKYFCKDCSVAICYFCVNITHVHHFIMLLEEAANIQGTVCDRKSR